MRGEAERQGPKKKETRTLSYQSREKKRQYMRRNIAIARAKQEHEAETDRRWFLTIVGRDCACARCGRVLRKGREMVYRHTPGETRCVPCAQRDPASKGYRTSLR
jgi:hypothetical protein